MLEFIDKILNKYKGLSFIVVMLLVMIAYALAISVSIAPAFMILNLVYDFSAGLILWQRGLIMGGAFGFSYITFAITLIFSVATLNWLMPFKLKPWRGRYYSAMVIPWYYHNSLVQLVRYTVLDIMTPSPLNILFYRLMGMKIGKGCMINTSNISDPCLIELEDYVTIGGSATIFAHYAQGGFIVVAPVLIKKGATIGLKASIMGDVIIGEKVLVKPHEMVYPKSRIERDSNDSNGESS